jgi:hypothetical protein
MRSGVSVAQSMSDLPSFRAASTPSSPSYTLEDAARSDSIKYTKSACTRFVIAAAAAALKVQVSVQCQCVVETVCSLLLDKRVDALLAK